MFAGTIRYTIIRGSIGLLAMATSILVYRFLEPSESGKLILVTGLVRGVMPLISFGTAYALIRFVVNSPKNVGRILYRRAAVATLIGTIVFSLLIGLLVTTGEILPEEVGTIPVLFVMLVAGYGGLFMNSHMLRGLGKLNTSSILDGSVELLPRLFIVPWLILGMATYIFYLQLQLAVVILFSLISFGLVRHSLSTKAHNLDITSVQPSIMDGYWIFTIQSQLHLLAYWLFTNVAIWMIRYTQSPFEVGLFGVAMRLTIIVISLGLTPLLTPLVYYLLDKAQDDTYQTYIVIKGTVIVATLMGMGTLFLAAKADVIIPLVFGESYQEAVPAFKYLAHFPFAVALQIFFLPILIKFNQQYVVIIAYAFSILIQLLIGWVILPILGIAGISFIIVGGYLLFNVILLSLWINRYATGIVGIIIKLTLVYLIAALISHSSYWFLGMMEFVIGVFMLKLVSWSEVRKQFNVALPILDGGIKNLRQVIANRHGID